MVSIAQVVVSEQPDTPPYPQLLLFAEAIHILPVVHSCTFIFGSMLFDNGSFDSLAIGSRDHSLAAIGFHLERIARNALRHLLGCHIVKGWRD